MCAFGVLVASPALTVHAEDPVRFVPPSTDVNDIGGCTGTAGQDSPICADIKNDKNPLFGPDGILTTVSGIFALITGVISTFMVIIGGLRYINSSGNPEKTASARKTIIYASIGVIIASLAGVITRFILSRINNA
jgi:hypothetical protein